MLLKKEEVFFVHQSFVGHDDYMRPESILDLFQDMAGTHAYECGLGYKHIYEKGLLWVVTGIEFNIYKNVQFGEYVKLITWPHRKGKLEFIREYEVRSLDGELLMSGISSWFLIDRDTHKLSRGEGVDFDGEFYEHTNYPGYRRFKLNMDKASDTINWNYQVTYSDLDHNMHMNNSKYLKVVYDKYINMDLSKIKRIAITYIHEVLLNEVIDMEYFKNTDGIDCYSGTVDGNKCFEVSVEVE